MTSHYLNQCWHIYLLIGPLGTNFNEILIKIYIFSFKKIHFKMSSGKWQPFCLSLNVLRSQGTSRHGTDHIHDISLNILSLASEELKAPTYYGCLVSGMGRWNPIRSLTSWLKAYNLYPTKYIIIHVHGKYSLMIRSTKSLLSAVIVVVFYVVWNDTKISSTLCGLEMHYDAIDLGQHWHRLWLFALPKSMLPWS